MGSRRSGKPVKSVEYCPNILELAASKWRERVENTLSVNPLAKACIITWMFSLLTTLLCECQCDCALLEWACTSVGVEFCYILHNITSCNDVDVLFPSWRDVVCCRAPVFVLFLFILFCSPFCCPVKENGKWWNYTHTFTLYTHTHTRTLWGWLIFFQPQGLQEWIPACLTSKHKKYAFTHFFTHDSLKTSRSLALSLSCLSTLLFLYISRI